MAPVRQAKTLASKAVFTPSVHAGVDARVGALKGYIDFLPMPLTPSVSGETAVWFQTDPKVSILTLG